MFFFALSTLALFIFCNNTNLDDLDLLSRVEQLQKDPDSLLLLHENIHSKKLLRHEKLAYCLLVTQSQDKLQISVSSDSLKDIAISQHDSVINHKTTENVLEEEIKNNIEYFKNLYSSTEKKYQKLKTSYRVVFSCFFTLNFIFTIMIFFNIKKNKKIITVQNEVLVEKIEEERRLRIFILQNTEACKTLNSKKNDPCIKFEADFWDKIIHEFDITFNHFAKRLKIQHDKLSHTQIIMACLMKINFDSFEIARCLGISKENARTIKSRMKNTLKISGQKGKLEEFIRNF